MSYILTISGHRYKNKTKEFPATLQFVKEQIVQYFIKNGKPSIILEGGAIGIDTLAHQALIELKFTNIETIKPNYNK